MTNTQNVSEPKISISVMDAIYNRRAVRKYKPEAVAQSDLRELLDAAVQAPTAMHEEPWSFAIIQDKDMLNRLSESAKDQVRSKAQGFSPEKAKYAIDKVNKPDYNVFYNANTLIVVYSKTLSAFSTADCWLAAENLMLAAHAKGLGTCVIGFAISALNTPEWKTELNISSEMTAIVPIILGIPSVETSPVPRKEPEIVFWK